MIKKSPKAIWYLCVLFFLATNNGSQATLKNDDLISPTASLPTAMPWDLKALSLPPQYQWSDKESPVWSLYYKGEKYKGKQTRIFAYYADPDTLNPENAEGKTFPAVVLVHGGGGRAFKQWAELWAQRGYAAIAMDLAGAGAEGKKLPDGGPDQTSQMRFRVIDQPIEDQWPYHAVANVILAHSLIRSFPKVDASRTAVTGISWGGYLTCIVAGLDNRFSAAVPVYGCGFLWENSAWLNEFEKMTPQQKDKWVKLWDPSMYIGSATMPMFFVNGTNDAFYPLDSYAKTYQLVKSDCNFRITTDMTHGHDVGWSPQEIGLFVDQYLINGIPLPVIMEPKLINGKISAKVIGDVPLTSANLHYTTGTAPINKLEWKTTPADIDADIISLKLPDDMNLVFFTVTDNRGVIISSKLVFRQKFLCSVYQMKSYYYSGN